jgi:uncharacterized flavoprotein (TIGR03862 family)
MSASPIRTAAIVGAGPAGLFAAELLAENGVSVTVYEKMPTPGRKFLMAGRGGLNLTHTEKLDGFLNRYGAARDVLGPMVEDFSPEALRAWADGLGAETFAGSSGRVFPKAMKASPLLRAWRVRLESLGVRILTRHHWVGWSSEGGLLIRGEDGETAVMADAVLLALGGASWPRLGSDGGWAGWLAARGVALAPFAPSNSGFKADWSEPMKKHAGEPVKAVALSHMGRTVRGEAMVSAYGVEGGAVYALSASLRQTIERDGKAVLSLDLKPDWSAQELASRLAKARRGESLSNTLRKAARLSPVQIALLREANREVPREPEALAAAIKDARIVLTGTQGLDRAISTAGGVRFESLDKHLMLKAIPGVFAAGEMLDWEAPTGGYLLQACFATGRAAAQGMLAWMDPELPSTG